MSVVVKIIEDVIDAVVDVAEAIVDAVVDLLETLWKDILVPILEFVAGLFGVEDEDVIETQVLTQRVVKEDVVASDLMVKISLEEQKKSIGVIDRLMAYTGVIRNRYSRYFTYGDTTFVDGLPDTNLRSPYVDESKVKEIIDAKYNINSTIIKSDLRSPTKKEYIGYKLQEDYGYTPYNNEMLYAGYVWRVTNIDYNFTNDTYDVYFATSEDQTTTTTTTTTVTVTSIDTTTDNVNTVVEENVVVEGSVQGIISDTTTLISETDETVDKGTVESSTTEDVTETIELDVDWDTMNMTYPAYPATRHYIVEYYFETSAEWFYWIYEVATNVYPELDNTNIYTDNLEMLPIITLRNSTININQDKTSDRYKQSKEMCNFLGVDVDTLISNINESPSIDNVEDAFIHFGLKPSDNSIVVSRTLFEMFNFIYADSGLVQDNDQYIATIREGSFNAALAWTSQSRTVTVGTIGPIGHYEHVISGKSLIMKHQETEGQYITLTLNQLSSITFIDRQGLTGTVGKDVDQEGFFVPVSYNFVTKLSPLEQYELYNRSLLLSIYSAQVTHLEWYETEAFGDLLGIIAIIITVLSFGSMAWVNGLAYAVQATAIGLAVAVGAVELLKLVMESTDNETIQGIAAVLYTIAMVYASSQGYGGVDANALTTGVTLFATGISAVTTAINIKTEIEMGELLEEQSVFSEQVEELEEEQDKAKEALDVGLSTADVLDVVALDPSQAYLEGIDARMHQAINAQYNYDQLYSYDAVNRFYENKFRLGVI